MIEKFTSDFLPNVHLNFDDKGMKMVLTLNVSPKLKPFMCKGKVLMKSTRWVYWVADRIKHPTKRNMEKTYEYLLKNAMTNVRDAKIELLKKEKEAIKQRQIF